MVHRRELDGDEIVLGNQGALWGSAMTWWDHETGSIWSQPIGEAIAGPLKGRTLELLPSTLTTWEAWQSANPDTLVLNMNGWQTAFKLSDMAIVVDLGTDSAAYTVNALRNEGVVNDVVAGVEIAVAIDPADEQRWAVFSRRLDDTVVDLALTEMGLTDLDSGTVFDPFTGVGRDGPLSDQSLDRLAAFTSFPQDYFTFFPNGRLWTG
jgi:hypothetical protein